MGINKPNENLILTIPKIKTYKEKEIKPNKEEKERNSGVFNS